MTGGTAQEHDSRCRFGISLTRGTRGTQSDDDQARFMAGAVAVIVPRQQVLPAFQNLGCYGLVSGGEPLA